MQAKEKAMKPGIPWSVKGIDTDAREAAKGAARRSGVTLGEWLNSVILDSADEPARPKPKNNFSRPMQLEDIARQIAKMMKDEPEPETPIVERILDRLGHSERRTVEALGVVSEQLAALGQQAQRQRHEDSGADIERRMRGLFDTLRAETASRHEADALRVAIEQVSARVAQGHDTRPQAVLEAQLAAVLHRIERAEQQFARVDDLERGLQSLAADLARTRASAQDVADESGRRMAAAFEEGLGQVRGTLSQLSARLADCEIATARVARDAGEAEFGMSGAGDFIAAARRAGAAKSGSATPRSGAPSRRAVFASVVAVAAITAYAMGWAFQSGSRAQHSGSLGVWGDLMNMSALAPQVSADQTLDGIQPGKGARLLAANLAQ